MSSNSKVGGLEWLLDQYRVTIATIYRTFHTCLRRLVAKFSLSPLGYSLHNIEKDINGWIKRIRDRKQSIEHSDRLCRFVAQSDTSTIHPQAEKIGHGVSKPGPTIRLRNPGFYNVLRVFMLFFTQGLAFCALDKFQTTSSWTGKFWVPHAASLVTTYILVLHHQPSWIPMLCYVAAQGLCVWMSSALDLAEIVVLFVVLASMVAEPHSNDTIIAEFF
ncbi:hypothetical protein GGS21DRAFT_511328 [Xylaria nigripes]|nr:hypothetical protein GGS21DRAFT_511328 [Xylaria nigripes]